MSTYKSEVQDALYLLAKECGYEFALGTAIGLLNGTLLGATATERANVVEIINTNRKHFSSRTSYTSSNAEPNFGRPG